MSTNGVQQKPSQTALFAALHRAIANKESDHQQFGPDHLAQIFLPANFRFFIRFKRMRANIRARFNKFLPGLHAYMTARTTHFDSLFADALDKGFPQIVLLGAGYDTRAHRFAARNHATKVIELDSAPTQNRKKDCLRKARIEVPPQVTFAPIDFNRESLQDVLEKAGYQSQQKTLFIWEGVTYYLEPPAVDATLQFFSQTAHNESLLAFDYAVSISEENQDLYGVKEFFETMKAEHGEERLMFAIEEGKTDSFLAQRGLQLCTHLDNQQIEKQYLHDGTASPLGPITGHFRFALASPQ